MKVLVTGGTLRHAPLIARPEHNRVAKHERDDQSALSGLYDKVRGSKSAPISEN